MSSSIVNDLLRLADDHDDHGEHRTALILEAAARKLKEQEEVQKSELSDEMMGHVDEWLAVNEKKPTDVYWGLFPIGMVGRWIERAKGVEKAQAEQPAADPEIRAAMREEMASPKPGSSIEKLAAIHKTIHAADQPAAGKE